MTKVMSANNSCHSGEFRKRQDASDVLAHIGQVPGSRAGGEKRSIVKELSSE